jgi:hypothetical protein
MNALVKGCLVAIPLLTATACGESYVTAPAPTAGPDDQESIESRSEIAEAWTRDGEYLVSPRLAADQGATRIGALVVLEAPGGMPQIEARLLAGGEPVGPWTPLLITWSEDNLHVAVANFDTVGDAAELRLNVSALDAIRRLQWSAVVPGDASDPDAASDAGGAISQSAPLRAEFQGYGIVTREQWGAKGTKCSLRDTKTKMAIHYTVTPSENAAAQVRGIQRYHMDSRGWCDIAYHFLVGIDGTIYEGRAAQLIGAHVARNNTGNIGISFIGCFHTSGCSSMGPTTPPYVMLDAGGRLLGTLSSFYGVPINTDKVRGHRDYPGADTNCPGNNLYARLGDMRAIGQTSTLADPSHSTPPGDDPPVVDPPGCSGLQCGTCETTSGCDWCAGRGACGATATACTWRGAVGTAACWDALWPCAVAKCWNPNVTLTACGTWTQNEDFSSGNYSVHRYWTRLPSGGPLVLRLERTAGTFAPALLVADRAGHMVYGHEPVALNPRVTVSSVTSGRDGSFAQVTLTAAQALDVYIYVTDWKILDAGFSGALPTTVKYKLTTTQSCTSP